MKHVSFVEDVALVSLTGCPNDVGFFADVLKKVADRGVDVDMISQTPPSGGQVEFSFTTADADIPLLMGLTASLKDARPDVHLSINGNNCKVSIADEDMAGKPGYAADVLARAASVGAEIRLITTSETVISLLIVNDGLAPLLDALK